MKKLIFCLCAFLCATLCANAQIMRAEELEKYAVEKYGDKWTEAAANLAKELELDKNHSLTYVQVIPCEGKTKEQLYIIMNYWYSATFNDANSVIKLNDKDAGVIIGSGYVANIAQHAGGTNSYKVNIRPIIKTDIKDGKVRVTYTIQCYDVEVAAGGGILGALSGTRATYVDEKWALETSYPFVEKDSHKAKRTASKALVMTHAYSNVIMDKIEEAVKNGLSGNEGDDW